MTACSNIDRKVMMLMGVLYCDLDALFFDRIQKLYAPLGGIFHIDVSIMASSRDGGLHAIFRDMLEQIADDYDPSNDIDVRILTLPEDERNVAMNAIRNRNNKGFLRFALDYPPLKNAVSEVLHDREPISDELLLAADLKNIDPNVRLNFNAAITSLESNHRHIQAHWGEYAISGSSFSEKFANNPIYVFENIEREGHFHLPFAGEWKKAVLKTKPKSFPTLPMRERQLNRITPQEQELSSAITTLNELLARLENLPAPGSQSEKEDMAKLQKELGKQRDELREQWKILSEPPKIEEINNLMLKLREQKKLEPSQRRAVAAFDPQELLAKVNAVVAERDKIKAEYRQRHEAYKRIQAELASEIENNRVLTTARNQMVLDFSNQTGIDLNIFFRRLDARPGDLGYALSGSPHRNTLSRVDSVMEGQEHGSSSVAPEQHAGPAQVERMAPTIRASGAAESISGAAERSESEISESIQRKPSTSSTAIAQPDKMKADYQRLDEAYQQTNIELVKAKKNHQALTAAHDRIIRNFRNRTGVDLNVFINRLQSRPGDLNHALADSPYLGTLSKDGVGVEHPASVLSTETSRKKKISSNTARVQTEHIETTAPDATTVGPSTGVVDSEPAQTVDQITGQSNTDPQIANFVAGLVARRGGDENYEIADIRGGGDIPGRTYGFGIINQAENPNDHIIIALCERSPDHPTDRYIALTRLQANEARRRVMFEKDIVNRETVPFVPARGSRNGIRNVAAHVPGVVTSGYQRKASNAAGKLKGMLSKRNR